MNWLPGDRLRLPSPWGWLQLGVGVLPLSAALGGLAVLVAVVLVWKEHYRNLVRQPLHWGLGGLALALVVSTVFSVTPERSWLGLFNFLPYFPVFAALGVLLDRPQRWRRLAWILVVGSLPVVGFGIAQLLGGGGNPPGRMCSFFAYANVFACYVLVTFTLTLSLGVESLQSASPGRERWLLLASLLGNIAALVWADSRNAWGNAFLVALAFVVYGGWRWLRLVIGAGGATVLGAAFAPRPWRDWLRLLVPAFFWARLTDKLYPHRPIVQLRTTQWGFAWSMAQERPWTGWGLRSFTPLYEAKMHIWLGHPHDLWLMLAAETGIVTAVAFYLWVGWILVAAGRALLQGDRADQGLALGYWLAFLALSSFYLLDIPLFDLRVNLLGWMVLAVVANFPRLIAPNNLREVQ